MQLGQAPMPGLGAMQMAMTAIPGAGLMAAGSMMAAMQTYQSRVRYEQSRLDAAPFLMSSSAALGYQPSQRTVTVDQPVTAGIAGQFVNEAGTGAVEKVGEAGLTQGELGLAYRRARREKLTEKLGSTIGGAYASLLETPAVTTIEELTGLGAAGRQLMSGKILEGGADIAALDPFTALSEKRRTENATVTRSITDQPFDSAGMQRQGLKLGYNPAQTMQMASQMAQAAGRPVDATEVGQGLAVQRMLGIGTGQTGGAIKQLRYAGELGGQGGGNMKQVANLIGDAVALGLEGSEIGAHLQEQSQFLGTMVRQGIGVDIDKMRALEASISQSGIAAPWRASDIGRQFITGAAQVGRTGPQSAEQFRLMRAHGFTGEGGMEEFFKVRMGMQSQGMAEEAGLATPQEAMSKFIEEMRVEGAGAFMQAGIIQKSFAGIGTTLGPEEAMALSKGLQAAEPGEFAIDTEAAARLVGAAAPSVKTEAAIEADRVRIGGQIAGSMQSLERTTNNMAGAFANLHPIVEKVVGAMEGAAERLEAISSGVASDPYYDPFGVESNP